MIAMACALIAHCRHRRSAAVAAWARDDDKCEAAILMTERWRVRLFCHRRGLKFGVACGIGYER